MSEGDEISFALAVDIFNILVVTINGVRGISVVIAAQRWIDANDGAVLKCVRDSISYLYAVRSALIGEVM